jgi:hypothetical protein
MIVTIEIPDEELTQKVKKELPEAKGYKVEMYEIPFWSFDLWKLMWWATLMEITMLIVPSLRDDAPIITFKL